MYFNFSIYCFVMLIYFVLSHVENYVPVETKEYLGDKLDLYSMVSFLFSFAFSAAVCLYILKFRLNKFYLKIIRLVFVFILFQLLIVSIMFLGYFLYDKSTVKFFLLFGVSKQHAFNGACLFIISIFSTYILKILWNLLTQQKKRF
jgi:cytochrome bd-type quinol oxidase subunit 2